MLWLLLCNRNMHILIYSPWFAALAVMMIRCYTLSGESCCGLCVGPIVLLLDDRFTFHLECIVRLVVFGTHLSLMWIYNADAELHDIVINLIMFSVTVWWYCQWLCFCCQRLKIGFIMSIVHNVHFRGQSLYMIVLHSQGQSICQCQCHSAYLSIQICTQPVILYVCVCVFVCVCVHVCVNVLI